MKVDFLLILSFQTLFKLTYFKYLMLCLQTD